MFIWRNNVIMKNYVVNLSTYFLVSNKSFAKMSNCVLVSTKLFPYPSQTLVENFSEDH